MPNPILEDAAAFRPRTDGFGIRLAVTTAATAITGIPGTGGEPQDILRIRVANAGAYSACVRFNSAATTDCMEILPGTVEVFTVPYSPTGVALSAICPTGTTTIQATAGDGY